jgi:hypothetical protein
MHARNRYTPKNSLSHLQNAAGERLNAAPQTTQVGYHHRPCCGSKATRTTTRTTEPIRTTGTTETVGATTRATEATGATASSWRRRRLRRRWWLGRQRQRKRRLYVDIESPANDEGIEGAVKENAADRPSD